MHYEIDDRVGFEPVSGLLWLISTPDNRITLPRFASQLLEILIMKNDQSLSREHLLDIIWHNNGLSASSNNLNNYISIIRRSLSSIGLNNVIITIPKYGFSFHAKNIITVGAPLVISHEEIIDKDNTQDECEIHYIDAPLEKYKSRSAGVKLKWISFLSCLISLLLIALYAYYPYYLGMPKSAMEKYQGKYENCEIYAIWNGQRVFYSMDSISTEIKDLIDRKIISCRLESKIYLYKSATSDELPFASHRVVISQCPNDKQAICRNIHKDMVSDN
ncbi:winged helix-turn-helix domain-containing protein [Serratia fonticola]|uniref:Winged helix-turn-helix domain-containing protein n=1 Tax=Serratia fonticola TaxID=47917 RepID=A0AAJ1YBJ4_SERFO|nr:winged helix-turn-helix domain-containing protein [Serratia fonticola]MDQ9127093.1 winged helix-turn-helix domain-containing protein [Serratia fonticola]